MKYCFDIDNTICSGGVPYEEAKPFPKVVKRINEWGPNTKISIDGNYDMVIEDFDELKEIFD